MSPAWRFLCLLPLAALALWAAQVVVTNGWTRAGLQRVQAAAPGVARACARHAGVAGTLRCKAREEGSQVTVLKASLSWAKGLAAPTR